ncbi:hypothetical protein SAMN05444349_1247 [Bacteroides faecichinchillae]|uniref:Ig-like domain-containing protein n=1 Tax=Bacteroides faecichinchillae TaxID=871325 RepID=A0A1M5CEB7_9BACE|nr:hypothetical protein [Bacteroides faecichinchillae]THG64607.1 hypothetical protein E5981_12280 [Bacteroides faecichinchillae]SHF53114.1 hypothetical protein SAMN05444349_1247 [Bacteroides faecichinchillae]
MQSKQRKISINYPPLQISGDLEVVGSVPDMQVYQADKKEYTPDYTLTPLTLFPRCNATDPNALSKVGAVNASLVNMKWYERLNGTRTLITSVNPNYVITETGAQKGQIQVKKNVSTISPLTLEFYAEYVDEKRTGQTHIFQFSRLIRAIDGTEAVPVLMLDSPSGLDWNPCRDIANQVITAQLMVGDEDVTATGKCKFFWFRVLEDGTLEQIIDGNGDNDWEFVSLNKHVLTINRDMIDTGMTYICKASYSADGTPANAPDDTVIQVSTTIRRKIPALEIDWKGVPTQVSDGTKVINPRPIIRDTLGDIPNPSELFNCKWYTKTGAGNYTLAATGYTPSIPFTDGMMLKLEVEDRGPFVAVVTEDGSYVVSENNEFIIVRQNG